MKQKILHLCYAFLAKCARRYLARTKPKIIGVTGSVGKTSCRMIVKQVLNFYLGNTKIYTSPKNFNSELGLVFSIFRIEQYTPGILSLLKKCFQIWKMSYFEPHNYDVLFLEYGVDHPGDMDFLLSIAKPDIAIFTKLDKIHSVYFETPNGIGDEKIKLLQQAKKRVYVNKSDTFSKSIFEDLKIKKKAFFSQARGIQFIKEKQKVYSEFFYGSKRIQTNLKGKENLDYMTLGFDILQDEFKKEIHDVKIKIKMQPGRMTFLEGINDSVLIDSSYNAGPESMKAMIANSFDFQKKLYPDYKVILVLGEMRELGDASKKEHKKLAKKLLETPHVFLVGEDMKYTVEQLHLLEYTGKIEHSYSSRKIGKKLKKYVEDSKKKSLILFKGSQNTIFMEEAIKPLLTKQSDDSKLPRQTKDWMKQKELFFQK